MATTILVKVKNNNTINNINFNTITVILTKQY